ncbi:MAG: hypothetical protein CEO40_192 [Parcubacteria group bacterium LiPW_72]|nr:MAG: hypothetical protein CEO40_192 [Parcubacteria group bacterium LiPW_72]
MGIINMTLDEATLYLQWGPSSGEDIETAHEKLVEADHIIRSAVEAGVLGEEEARKIILFNPESYWHGFAGGF